MQGADCSTSWANDRNGQSPHARTTKMWRSIPTLTSSCKKRAAGSNPTALPPYRLSAPYSIAASQASMPDVSASMFSLRRAGLAFTASSIAAAKLSLGKIFVAA